MDLIFQENIATPAESSFIATEVLLEFYQGMDNIKSDLWNKVDDINIRYTINRENLKNILAMGLADEINRFFNQVFPLLEIKTKEEQLEIVREEINRIRNSLFSVLDMYIIQR